MSMFFAVGLFLLICGLGGFAHWRINILEHEVALLRSQLTDRPKEGS